MDPTIDREAQRVDFSAKFAAVYSPFLRQLASTTEPEVSVCLPRSQSSRDFRDFPIWGNLCECFGVRDVKCISILSSGTCHDSQENITHRESRLAPPGSSWRWSAGTAGTGFLDANIIPEEILSDLI